MCTYNTHELSCILACFQECSTRYLVEVKEKKKLAKPVFHKVLSNEQGLSPSLPLARSILKGLRRVCETATNGCKPKLPPSVRRHFGYSNQSDKV